MWRAAVDCGCSFVVEPGAFVDVTIALRLRITDPPAGAFQDGRVGRCLLLSLANVNIEYSKRKETGKMSNRDNKRASGSSRTKLLLTANANRAATSSKFPAPKKVMHSKTENVDVVATLSELKKKKKRE